MLFYISVYGLIFCVIATIFLIFFPVRMTRGQLIGFWTIYIILLAVFGFHIDPGYELDLYRIYKEIDAFRAGQSSITDSSMIIMNIVYWIIAKTNDNGWLVVITVLIWGACVGKVTSEYLRSHRYDTRAVVLYYLAANGGCFVFYLLTNIRCSIVFAVWLYAYFIWYKRKRWVYYVLTVLMIFIHSVGILVMGLTLLYHFLKSKNRIRGYVITFVAILFIGYLLNNTEIVGNILSSMGTSYASYLSEKWQAYSIRGIEFQQGREMMFRILSSLLYFVLLIELHLKGNREYEIFGFFIMVMYVGINMSIIFERFPYLLGLSALPILNESSMTKRGIKKKIFYIGTFAILFGQIIWSIYEIMLWVNFKDNIYFGNIVKIFNV